MNRNTSTYVDFLNNNNWSVFHWSQPATWGDPFWPNKQYSGGIADVVSLDVLNSEDSWLNVYDATFEQDLNAIADGSVSGTNEDFWFTADGQTSSTVEISGADAKAQLLNIIKKSELNK